MIRKYFLPVLAVAGVVFAVWMVNRSSRAVPIAMPVAMPATADFTSFVAGAGLIESASENIAIAPVVGGVVKEVLVKVGDMVKTGEPLFRVDDRELQAELIVRKAQLSAAREKLARTISLPRAEEVPPLRARVEEAKAQLEDAKAQFAILERLPDRRAVSADVFEQKKWAVEVAEANYRSQQATFDLTAAGAWAPDIAIAKTEVEQAAALVAATEIEIDRRVTRAPIDGRVLQVRVRPGEFAPAGERQGDALMLLGNVDRLHVRVDIDENDAWRIAANAAAHASVRGNRDLRTDLMFVKVEPYVVPKRSLTGESNERVDTRVLQVVYSFPADALPVYVGQQMDVFIEAPPASGGVGTPVLPATRRSGAAADVVGR
jgi:multidrug resistance efflux pump